MMHKLKLNEASQQRIVWPVPWFIRTILVDEPHLILAGGSIAALMNNTKSEDYDLWYLGKESFDDYANKLRTKGLLNQCSLTTNHEGIRTFRYPLNAASEIKIQLIQMEGATTPEQVLENFDLIPCMIAIDGEDNVYSDRRTLKAILEKRIEFNKVEYPLVAFKRFLKYHDKGYSC